ncbi:DUF805 domain-containing protein [Paenibacillus herberti]|uniref:DUF805 domain-containing protein n=1 Tax=Paenibacillus herberti TaxID=1619309 RepID=A0A229P5S7_9BACL|nr:DUF805 domain-containing protein [Paenibacillus herberti]OXM17401.1 hypothetical protein CGZ75_00105 [Paenibacillus herberti]
MGWFLKAIKNYAGFAGRSRRMEYWMFILFSSIFTFIISVLEALIGIPSLLSFLFTLFLLVPSLSVAVRRLHDTGRTGWWNLIGFVPLIGIIVLTVFMCLDGEEHDNEYGRNPKTS